MNSKLARSGMLMLLLLCMLVHSIVTAPLANTPFNMLLFHGSAAALDWALLWLAAPVLLSGRMLAHIEWLLLADIVGNALGWVLYMSYAPPTFYNCGMWLLMAMQVARLLLDDDAINSFRDFMVRRRHSGRAASH